MGVETKKEKAETSETFIWDMLNYAIPCLICVILFLIFDVKLYTSEENFSALVCLMLMFGWASKVLF